MGSESNKEQRKSCFVISPIGEEDTPIRKHADQFMEYFIEPAMKLAGFAEPLRADQSPRPGAITNELIEHILEDDLVIADLTGWNANVLYELAIRHCFNSPVILMISKGASNPFDVYVERTIPYDINDLANPKECIPLILEQIKFIEDHPNDVGSPIARVADLLALRRSGDSVVRQLAEIMSEIQRLRSEFVSVRRNLSPSGSRLENAFAAFADLSGGETSYTPPPLSETLANIGFHRIPAAGDGTP